MQVEEEVKAQEVNMISKVKNGWTSMPRARRIAIGVGMATTVSIMAYSAIAASSNYTPLYTNLSYEEAGNIKASLEENGMTDYKIGEGGSSILVPTDQVDKVRMELAVSGLSPSNGVGYELFDSTSLGMTEQERKVLYQRALEGELRRSIMTLADVKDARIHLNMSTETVFIRDAEDSTASVILDLNYGAVLTEKQVNGIVALVTGAVKNLKSSNVQIIDTAGNLLSHSSDSSLVSDTGDRIAQESNYEAHLEEKLTAQLGKVLGYDKIATSVRVSLNQTSEEQRTEEYTDGAVLSEQTSFDRVDGVNGTDASGSPIDNNIQNVVEGEAVDNVNDPNILEYDNTTNYQPGMTETHTVKPPGELSRVDVSVIYSGELTPQLQQEIERHVASIAGISLDRGDTVSVAGIPFNLPLLDDGELTIEDESWLASLSTSQYFLYGTLLATALLGALAVGSKRKKTKERLLEERTVIPTVTDENQEDKLRDLMLNSSSVSDAELTPVEQVVKMFENDFESSVKLLKLWVDEEARLVRRRNEKTELDGVEKAARLLIVLGKTITVKTLQTVSKDDATKLGHIMTKVKTVPYQDSTAIAIDFIQLADKYRLVATGGYDFARTVLSEAIGENEAGEVLGNIKGAPRSKAPFELLKQMDSQQLFNELVDQNPQTIALVLCYLGVGQSAKIISMLPAALRLDVVRRMGLMNNTSSQIVEAVENVMESRLQNSISGEMTQVGGLSKVVDVLNSVDRATQVQILNDLGIEEPKLAADILDSLFTFEDIVTLNDDAIRKIITSVRADILALSLKGAGEKIVEAVLRNMSERQGKTLREDMEYLGGVKQVDVENAQREIIEIIRDLEETGEIVVSREEGGNDLVY